MSCQNSESTLPENIQKDADGAYHWIYCMNLWRNKKWLWMIIKIFTAIFGGFALFSVIVTLIHGEFDIWALLVPLLSGLAVMIFSIIIWFLYVLVLGGEYWCMFTMNDRGVTQRQLDKTYNKAQTLKLLALVVAGATGSNPGVAGRKTSNAWHMDFSDVKTLVLDREYDMIGLKGILITSAVYAKPEDYDIVLEYIISKTSQDVKIVEKG